MDESKGVISHIQADFADRRDSVLLESIVEPLHHRLLTHELPVQEIVADTNYSNGLNYALLEARGITPWIPVFGKYKPETAGFTYAAETDCFTCLAGKTLPFKGFDKSQDGGLSKVYRASSRDCRVCPYKPTCAPRVKKRQLIRTAYAAHYRRALIRQQSRQGQRMRRLRQRTIDPVFGSLLQHYGLRRMNVRGQAGAHKTMLLTAVAFTQKTAQVPAPTASKPRRDPALAYSGGHSVRQAARPALGNAYSDPREADSQKVNRLNRVLQQPRPVE